MQIQLTNSQILILKAALFELDLEWRKGTANAGFHSKTVNWLRGPNTPWMHESGVSTLLELIDRPGVTIHINN